MRNLIAFTIVVVFLTTPAIVKADDSIVQSLIQQLRPHKLLTRGLPRPGASAGQDTTASAVMAIPPPDAPSADLNVLFANGSAKLTPAAVGQLNDLGRALTDASMGDSRFLIEGHTDTVGTRDMNQALSQLRAAAVVKYLIEEFHISTSRLVAKGLGKDALLVPTPDQTPEARNRRVHVVNLDG